jgi:hypothetical protein
VTAGLCMDCKESDFPTPRGGCPMPLTDCINGVTSSPDVDDAITDEVGA